MKKSNEKVAKRFLSGALAILLALGMSNTAMADRNDGMWWGNDFIPHGTADEWITEDMVNNTPPSDYKVNDATQGKAENGEYNKYFLKDKIQEVRIEVDENNFNYLLQNAMEEEYVMTTSVTIGDTTLGYCGLKTKGAYTLEHAYTDNPGSDRFSFTVNFGKYIKKADYGKKQNFYGCNKISFNNFYFDKSMMKEFCALMLMEEMGLPTPQFGIAKLYINGEYYGVYAMVEAFDESILEQYYGVDDDELSSYLCKPENTRFLYEDIMEDDSPLWEEDEDTYADVEDMLPTVKEWVRKLNLLSEGKDFDGNDIDVNSDRYVELLGQIMDIDETVKYFATHSWLCQLDSMFVGEKNFGLYINQDGKSLIIPWDYDLSFGCYYPSTAENTANYNVDAMYMLSGWGNNTVGLEVREDAYEEFPFFNVIFQNEKLMEQYHGYMKDCSKIAALGGILESTGEIYNPGYINSYIEKFEEELIAAATEKLADNVYYMNGANQPRDVKQALPNLSKIIAMRAVGVVNQIDGVDAIVTGAGCDISTLGNGQRGENTTRGTLSLVNAQTGMYVTAEYTSGRGRSNPLLTVNVIEPSDGQYDDVKKAIGCTDNDSLIVYDIKNNVKASSEYTLTIPVSKTHMENGGQIKIYSYIDDELTELEADVNDNLYTIKADDISCIAVMQVNGNVASNDPLSFILPLIIGIVVIVGIIAVVMLVGKRKKVKDKPNTKIDKVSEKKTEEINKALDEAVAESKEEISEENIDK